MGLKLNRSELHHLLNRSAQDLPASATDKLRAARQLALQRQKVARTAPVLAWLGAHGVLPHPPFHGHRAWQWAGAAALALMLAIGVAYWHHNSGYEHTELDIAILTDDLPVHMYVD